MAKESDCGHEWTPIAPEHNPDEAFDPNTTEIWSWCVRCGALSLGDHVYTPGPHQKLTIVEAEDA